MSRSYLGWTPPYIFQRPWLDGAFLNRVNPPTSWDPETDQVAAQTHAGTHILQRWLYGAKAPRSMKGLVFTLSALFWDSDDCYRLRESQQKGLVRFAGGLRVSDVIDIVTGETYTLRRPLAAGVVTGVTSTIGGGTHPIETLLDDVVDTVAATVSVQTVTALKTGQLTVRYTPVHWVMVAAGFAIPQPGEQRASVVLEEKIVGTFD